MSVYSLIFLWGIEYEADVANGANEADEVDEVVLSEQNLSMFGESAMALPVFSHSAGVYAQSFCLELTAEESATIRFTLDGSIPTQYSPVYRTDRANLGLDLDITGFTNIRWLLDPSMGWFDISGAQIRADLFPSIADYAFHIGDFNAEYIRGLPITVTAVPLDGYSFSHFAVSGGINGIFVLNPMVITPPANNDAPIVVEAVFE